MTNAQLGKFSMAWYGNLLLALFLAASALPSVCAEPAPEFATPYAERADVAAYVAELATAHGFDAQALAALLGQVRQRQDIIERISKPAESVWTWARYQKHLVDEARVAQGVAFWAEHETTLSQAEATYGVPAHYILAILGIETRYGKITGSFPVLEALMTLGFDYPPRAPFFRKELTEFLLLAREEGKDPRTLYGSYAGAMGYGQFISSSYRHYAVDFDDDGVRDIWQDPDDAIGSVANYFARHRWQGDGPVTFAVSVQGDRAQALANASLQPQHTLAEWQAMGVAWPTAAAPASTLSPELPAALFKLDGAAGDEYWLGLHDFYVITRYNHSHMYAMAVHQLAQLIKARRAAED